MICPFKFNTKTIDNHGEIVAMACQCEKEGYALWEDFTGTCGLKTLAFLEGRKASIADELEETK